MNSFKDPSKRDIQLLCQDKAAGGNAFRRESVKHDGPLGPGHGSTGSNGIRVHGMPALRVELEPDRSIYNASWKIGRFANEDFGSLAGYLAEVLQKVFEEASHCSVYTAEKIENNGTRRTILEHHLTVLINGSVKTESFEKRGPITGKDTLPFRVYSEKKPRFIDYRQGMELVFKNLHMESDTSDVYPIRRNILKDDIAVVPLYYREKHKPFGVLVLEGDLKCKGSQKGGFTKAFYSAKAAIELGAQLGFIFMHKYDCTTSFPKKKDFDIDLKSSLREIARERSHNRSKSVFVILVDLDNFKSVNDNFGYLAGDALLRAEAEAIEKSVRQRNGRPHDRLYRWGGEEFAVLLEDTTWENAITVAERIRKEIGEKRIEAAGKEIGVTCSIGLLDVAAALPQLDKGNITVSSEHVFRKCDELLKAAKKSGKDKVAIFLKDGIVGFI